MQRIDPDIGQTAETMLKAPQPPPPEPLVASLTNDIADRHLDGDANGDGYADVAVGAPSAGGTGRVYLYYGSSTGPLQYGAYNRVNLSLNRTM